VWLATLFRFPLPDAIPALGWDIHCPTQRDPHLTHRNTRLDRVIGGLTTDLLENEVTREHTTVRVPELIGNGQSEFAQTHKSTLVIRADNKKCPRLSPGAFSKDY
jgi:hypothetical protein